MSVVCVFGVKSGGCASTACLTDTFAPNGETCVRVWVLHQVWEHVGRRVMWADQGVDMQVCEVYESALGSCTRRACETVW